MNRRFAEDILIPEKFVITMELVPKAESTGRSIDAVIELADEMTAATMTVVNGANNIFKVVVVSKNADHDLMVEFRTFLIMTAFFPLGRRDAVFFSLRSPRLCAKSCF